VVVASREFEPEGFLKLRAEQEKPNAVVLQDS